MSFLETPRFPVNISYGSRGGPNYSTTVITIKSGQETRNKNWLYPVHEYDVAYGIRELADLESLVGYFHAVGGRAYGFRYKDWIDYKSCVVADTPAATDQTIGTGDGSNVTFQIKKTYTKGALSQVRLITKPISGTVLISVDDVTQTEVVDYTIDYTTGIVTFEVGSTPPDTELVKWGGEFDTPVRFDSDSLSTDYSHYQSGSIETMLREIRI